MSVKNKKKVFLLITQGTHVKLFLQSPVLKSILESTNYEIILFSPAAEEQHFIEEYELENVKLIKSSQQGGNLWNRFNNIRRYLVTGKMSKTREMILRSYKNHKPIYHLIATIINFLFRHIKYSKNIFSLFDRIIFRDKYFKKFFVKYKPEAVILLSTVHNEAYYMLQRARLQRVKTIHIVESWDNPSAKLSSVELPDYSLVWNETMCDELNEFLNIKKNTVLITGSPFHDIAANKDNLISKIKVAERYGMNPNLCWIILATTLDSLYPDFDFFLEEVDKLRNKGLFFKDFQILIRPHPQAISGYSEGKGVDELKKIIAKYDYIFFDTPKVIKSDIPVLLDKKDIRNYAEILNASNLIISFFSTATIDGVALDKPVLLPAFENVEKKSFFPTMRNRTLFTHHSKLIATGGVDVVYDYEELLIEVNKHLNNIDEKHILRKKVVDLECGVIDGYSYRRVANAILDIIDCNLEEIDSEKAHRYY